MGMETKKYTELNENENISNFLRYKTVLRGKFIALNINTNIKEENSLNQQSKLLPLKSYLDSKNRSLDY